jgi:DNA invertase Pin-like site-specific DNA recombinase
MAGSIRFQPCAGPATQKGEPMTRVALYARVSTANGHQNPEMQLRELREFVERRGWQITGEYVDRGVSGSKDRRPALGQRMAAAQGRKFDVLLVWKLDRFARSLKHLVNALAEFEALGIAFVSFRDNLDLTTPAGRLMFQIIGAMAEFERALIQERVRAGLRNAKLKGVRLGRPRVFVSESRIEALRASGTSWRAIAKELGVGIGTARLASQSRAKNLCASFGTGIGGQLCPLTQPSHSWSHAPTIRSCSVSTRTSQNWPRPNRPVKPLGPSRSRPIWQISPLNLLLNLDRCPV